MSAWPAWATESVAVVPYDPGWPARAAALMATVVGALGGPVHHVGSTAVPGLAAKPIIDLLCGVAGVDDDAGRSAAAALGWQLVPPELDARPYRRLLVLVEGGRRAAHLHLVSPGHRRWDDELAFRDALRADDDLRDAYAELKRRLAADTVDREDYTEGKTAFIEGVLRRVPGRRSGRAEA